MRLRSEIDHLKIRDFVFESFRTLVYDQGDNILKKIRKPVYTIPCSFSFLQFHQKGMGTKPTTAKEVTKILGLIFVMIL